MHDGYFNGEKISERELKATEPLKSNTSQNADSVLNDLSAWGLSEEDLKDLKNDSNRVQPLTNEELTENKSSEPIRSLDFLLDIPLELSVEIGHTKLEIKELLRLGPGSVVELDKLAGEPLDVYVNGRLIARGEAVVVNEKFGVRLTEVVSKRERLENLK